MDNNEVKEYLNTLYVDADGEELDFITNEVNQSLTVLNLLDDLEVNDVKMASWAFESEITQLREDVVDHLISNEEVLQNADQVQDGYVKYVKVV